MARPATGSTIAPAQPSQFALNINYGHDDREDAVIPRYFIKRPPGNDMESYRSFNTMVKKPIGSHTVSLMRQFGTGLIKDGDSRNIRRGGLTYQQHRIARSRENVAKFHYRPKDEAPDQWARSRFCDLLEFINHLYVSEDRGTEYLRCRGDEYIVDNELRIPPATARNAKFVYCHRTPEGSLYALHIIIDSDAPPNAFKAIVRYRAFASIFSGSISVYADKFTGRKQYRAAYPATFTIEVVIPTRFARDEHVSISHMVMALKEATLQYDRHGRPIGGARLNERNFCRAGLYTQLEMDFADATFAFKARYGIWDQRQRADSRGTRELITRWPIRKRIPRPPSPYPRRKILSSIAKFAKGRLRRISHGGAHNSVDGDESASTTSSSGAGGPYKDLEAFEDVSHGWPASSWTSDWQTQTRSIDEVIAGPSGTAQQSPTLLDLGGLIRNADITQGQTGENNESRPPPSSADRRALMPVNSGSRQAQTGENDENSPPVSSADRRAVVQTSTHIEDVDAITPAPPLRTKSPSPEPEVAEAGPSAAEWIRLAPIAEGVEVGPRAEGVLSDIANIPVAETRRSRRRNGLRKLRRVSKLVARVLVRGMMDGVAGSDDD
ncbi:MAG: hypothetical protein M1818_005531 [Claussenomyces sp. TS43310]|nr:MAG: hypothetical protein M1818_005531 [Claussenomyces sp. TS43310]